MEFVYPFFIAFIMVFIAELGDKTQLIVLSFSGSLKTKTILFGVALGSFFSHGIAILFGSSISLFENQFLHDFIHFFTYSSFIFIGILSLLPKKEKIYYDKKGKESLTKKISHLKLNYLFVIALTIMIGEFGDKTFLASIGFATQYPSSKLLLILGSVFGMIASNSIAIVCGKFLNKYISEAVIKKISGILFLIFGILGFIL